MSEKKKDVCSVCNDKGYIFVMKEESKTRTSSPCPEGCKRHGIKDLLSDMYDEIIILNSLNMHNDGSYEVKDYDIEEHLGKLHNQWVFIQGALEENKSIANLTIFKICSHCNKEFKLKNDHVVTFMNCPHCEQRNDIWIRLEVNNE